MYHILLPIVAARQYLLIPKKWQTRIHPIDIEGFSMIHNMGLCVFSLYSFIFLFIVLLKHGIYSQPGYYFHCDGVKTMLCLFYLSKYYEYVDTMILYAKKKDPIFLQKFHHVGATICWHLGYIYEFEGIYFASLVNSGVHTIMYGYYFLSLFKQVRPYIHRYKVYITSLQVGQLVFGFVLLPWFYYYKESVTNRRVLIIFDIYIGCLIILFLQFMMRNYSIR